MAYDLMNRRDNVTNHHTSVEDSLETVDIYIERGFTPSKLILGFAFYAKWFTTEAGADCTEPIGCPVVELEGPDGSDTLQSGAVTFEVSSYQNNPDFVNAMENGKVDEEVGGAWYWDSGKNVFWTWDTPDLISQKFEKIVAAKGLGGVMAWSLAQDSHDWSHFKAISAGVEGME